MLKLQKLLVGIAIAGAWLAVASEASAFSKADAARLTSSYTSKFFELGGSVGYIKDRETGGEAYFWGQAEMIECYIDAYEWTGDPAYASMATQLLNGFKRKNGTNWGWNIYNDDIFWAVLAFARTGMLTGNSEFTTIAKNNFDLCYARAWDDKLGGGLYWTTDNAEKNACVNGPGAIAAYLMYQITGDVGYRTKASNIYNWERSVLFNSVSGSIADNIRTNGVINGGATTYNQGTFIGAANLLGYTNDAMLAAHFTMIRMSNGDGLLPQYGIDGNNSGFNAIFLRWMRHFINSRNLEHVYGSWLQRNAAAAWNVRRLTDDLSWCQWQSMTPVGTNFFAWDCISSFEALHAATPLKPSSSMPFPTDPRGHWPLDASSGSVVSDLSPNANHGNANGTWTSAGRVNGCLSFNGVDQSAQLTNRIGSDFTISMWVKTTQASAAGQWYQGKALVDADAPFTMNDFGTALVAGKFAFGIGNPDTTLTSTASINDGNWHHCVATRERTSGTLRVYVDGTLQGSTVANNRAVLNASSKLVLGAFTSGNGWLNGSLDDVKVFSRALKPAEVAALYYSAVAAPTLAPAALTATPANNRVTLTWGDAPSALSYNVKRSLVDGGPYTTIASNVTTPTYTDVSAPNYRTCYYVVSGVNHAGESPDSAQAAATPSPLVLWLRAEALTNLVSGAAVDRWQDSSGRGLDAMQSLPANRPNYVATAINGKPAVRFSQNKNSYLWFYRPVQDDFTITFVYQSSQGIGTGTEFYNGAGLVNGEVGGDVRDFGISLNASGQILAGTGNPDRTIRSGTGLNDGRPHVVTFKRLRSTGSLTLYIDGSLVAANTGSTASLNSPSILTLGSQQTLNDFFTGDIGEVQIYGAALSDSERQGQENALKCKYGIAGATAPASPIGLTSSIVNRQIRLNWQLSAGASSYTLWRSTDANTGFQVSAVGLTSSSFVDLSAPAGVTNYYRIASVNGCSTSGLSGTVQAYVPLPLLEGSISASGGAQSLKLQWPSWASGWTLYVATNQQPPFTWRAITNLTVTNDAPIELMLPMEAPMSLYRLGNP